jgi:hypothetical protein
MKTYKHTMLIDGTQYRPMRPVKSSCTGCVGLHNLLPEGSPERAKSRHLCAALPCTPSESPTGRNVIWVEVT